MPIERKQIVKSYLLLCEGRDAEGFLINYLNCDALKQWDSRFSNEIQVFDFGGNDNLGNFLKSLMNMDKFGQVKSIAIIRDAEKDFDKAVSSYINVLKQNTMEVSYFDIINDSGLRPFTDSDSVVDICMEAIDECRSEPAIKLPLPFF